MSIVKVDTVEGRTSSRTVDANVLARRIASVWVNFNGQGTVAIRDSENVSSLTDTGTGTYTINFTTPLADTNYAMSTVCDDDTTAVSAGGGKLVGSSSMATKNSAGTPLDTIEISMIIFGGVT